MVELLLLLISVLMVIAGGIFVAAEFAFVTVDRSSVDRDAESGDKRAVGVRAALRRLSTQLSAAQIGITLTNLVIGFLAEPAISALLEGPLEAIGVSEDAVTGVALVVGFILANAFTMVFSELVPKNLAITHPLQTAKGVQGFQRGFTVALGPVITGANELANTILRRMGIEPQEELASARSPDELGSLVRHSAERGTLEMQTATLLEKSLDFGERRADDAMTPHVRVTTLAPDDPVMAVIEAARESGRSRFPVVEDGSEQVEGIVHVKHAVSVPYERRGEVPVSEVMAEPVLVPSSMELDPLLTELRKVGLQIAIVVDEFGSFDGIVTLEDLIEEIVGEVRDEHDPREDPVRLIEDGVWGLSGLLRPDEVASYTSVHLPEDEDYETVAGLIAFELGEVPEQGDEISVEALNEDGVKLRATLTVLTMDELRVDRIRLAVKPLEPGEEAEDES